MESQQSLFTDLCQLQRAIKCDKQWGKIYQIKVKEAQDQIQGLHLDYYEQLLCYCSEFKQFKNDFNPEAFTRSKKKQDHEERKMVSQRVLQRSN